MGSVILKLYYFELKPFRNIFNDNGGEQFAGKFGRCGNSVGLTFDGFLEQISYKTSVSKGFIALIIGLPD